MPASSNLEGALMNKESPPIRHRRPPRGPHAVLERGGFPVLLARGDRRQPARGADVSRRGGEKPHGPDDAPTFERALRALEEGDLAWLGFMIVYDAGRGSAQHRQTRLVTKKYGDEGSADGEPLVFFCNDAKEIVVRRGRYSPRDTFQMKDVTRGPSMHNEQFEGLTWCERPSVRPRCMFGCWGASRRGQRSGGARRTTWASP